MFAGDSFSGDVPGVMSFTQRRTRHPKDSRSQLSTWVRVGVIVTALVVMLVGGRRASAEDDKNGNVLTLRAGCLVATWEVGGSGARLQKMELADGGLIFATNSALFTVTVRGISTGDTKVFTATEGWQSVSGSSTDQAIEIRWEKPVGQPLPDLTVVLKVEAVPEDCAFRWHLQVSPPGGEYSLWEVRFPELTIPQFAPDAVLLYPKAAGVAEPGVWDRPFEFGGRYPSGWMTMQLGAVYRGDGSGGLYLGIHDPQASTKEPHFRSNPEAKTLHFHVTYPVPDMGRAEAQFQSPGTFVTQFFKGDWFDAAQIYRCWVEAEAPWYPRLGPEGREDTPLWMRELPLWILSGGAPEACMPSVLRFRESMEVPCGFHWYNWHEIPFDNDYPHYFPTKPGFAEGVQKLQASGVHVMPYINGRLWDSRDRGMEDFQFSQVALPAATKNHAGDPFLESYGSKEADGSPVRLAVMCPTTPLWQEKVAELVRRLLGEIGTHAVYIDQVAAAHPTLCADPTHGHPLGGGHWWNEGYWKLLENIRAAMPPDRMITTECNAEPFVRWFDGYLSWHWQYDHQVPLFPAVYGGAIQMFGRWFGDGGARLEGEEKRNWDRSVRMRLGQQLVFGEQLGWISPAVLDEPENARFLQQLARLRWQFRPFFYAGRMGRPPRLESPVPKITADWKWGGKSVVTTDAILVGQWVWPAEKQAIVIAVNVSEETLPASITATLGDPDVSQNKWRIAATLSDGLPHGKLAGNRWWVECEIPPLTAYVWHALAESD